MVSAGPQIQNRVALLHGMNRVEMFPHAADEFANGQLIRNGDNAPMLLTAGLPIGIEL